MKKILNVIFLDTTGIKLLFWIAVSISIAYWQGADPKNHVFLFVKTISGFFTGYYLAAVAAQIIGIIIRVNKNGKRKKKK